MTHNLNLRGIACPMNFVKTKLYLDKLPDGEILKVNLDAGEPVESVYNSIQAEGHKLEEPEIQDDGTYLLTIKKIAIISLMIFSLHCGAAFAQATALSVSSSANKIVNKDSKVQEGFNVAELIRSAREAVALAPADTEKRLQLARLLRRSGNIKQAAIEYLNITVINPKYFVAYHEMLLCNPSTGQIDEAIARLKNPEEIKAKQLPCKMALSELYERKEDYYQAARILVDLQYAQNIPPKYVSQIASRIHMLLGKTKDTRTIEKAIEQKTNVEEEEFNPSTPVPMPDLSVNNDTPVQQLRSTKVKEGYGHAQLAP
jgi:tRNA 2-thiouridine synthesizing protein A